MGLEEESDSAPEDIAFKDAKSEALGHLKTVADAAKEKKKVRKEAAKRKQAFLADQKMKRMKRQAMLSTKRLPSDVLENLSKEPKVSCTGSGAAIGTEANTKIKFDDVDENEEDSSSDFLALETERTNFKVVTSGDLRSAQFRPADAISFRERMLFSSGRVRRAPHSQNLLRRQKLRIAGLDKKVTSKK